MKDIIWLNPELIQAIHDQQIQEHGGRYGIRDRNLLYSALESAKNSFHYEDATLVALAAKTVHAITSNHPFVDGNKRTAYIAMRLFLQLNGHDIDATPQEKVQFMLAIASSKHTVDSIEVWLSKHLVKK